MARQGMKAEVMTVSHLEVASYVMSFHLTRPSFSSPKTYSCVMINVCAACARALVYLSLQSPSKKIRYNFLGSKPCSQVEVPCSCGHEIRSVVIWKYPIQLINATKKVVATMFIFVPLA